MIEQEHLPLWITATLLVMWAVHVVRIAGPDPNVAATIVRFQGITTFTSALVGIVGSALYLFRRPALLIGLAISAGTLAGSVAMIRRRSASSRFHRYALLAFDAIPPAAVIAGALIFAVTWVPFPWLPAEAVTFTDGRGCIVFVLGEEADGRWLVALSRDDRDIVWLDTNAIASRVALTDPAVKAMVERGLLRYADDSPAAGEAIEGRSCPLFTTTQDPLTVPARAVWDD